MSLLKVFQGCALRKNEAGQVVQVYHLRILVAGERFNVAAEYYF